MNPRKLLDKKERGAMKEVFTGCISVVKWKNNKVVSVASNKLRSDPRKKTRRWNRIEKKHNEVDQLNSIYIYNQHMGGVDLLDQQIAAYRYRIRSKKLYWHIFAWSVNDQAVNGWILCKEHYKNNTLLEFSRRLVIAT